MQSQIDKFCGDDATAFQLPYTLLSQTLGKCVTPGPGSESRGRGGGTITVGMTFRHTEKFISDRRRLSLLAPAADRTGIGTTAGGAISKCSKIYPTIQTMMPSAKASKAQPRTFHPAEPSRLMRPPLPVSGRIVPAFQLSSVAAVRVLVAEMTSELKQESDNMAPSASQSADSAEVHS